MSHFGLDKSYFWTNLSYFEPNLSYFHRVYPTLSPICPTLPWSFVLPYFRWKRLSDPWIRVSSLGQIGSVGQKVSIAGFLDRVGHLGGVVQWQARCPVPGLGNQGCIFFILWWRPPTEEFTFWGNNGRIHYACGRILR